jgi:hypothetical protein
MDKNMLVITDPRDAFALMLMERLEACEDIIRKLEKKVTTLEDAKNTITVKNKGFHSYQCVGAMKLAVSCSNTCVEDGKRDLEVCVQLLVDKFGLNIFKSLTAVIILDDNIQCGYKWCTRIYMNFKELCWIHEFTKMIDEINFPPGMDVSVCVSKGTICYGDNESYSSEDEDVSGIVYRLFDIYENLVEKPTWTNWNGTCTILKLPSPQCSDYGDEDDWDVEP